jgi:hypothetical protein
MCLYSVPADYHRYPPGECTSRAARLPGNPRNLSTANVEREDPNPAGVGVGWDSCQGVRAAAIKPCACTHPSTEAGRSYLFGFGAAACMGGPIGERGIEHVLCFWSSCSVFQSLSGWRWDRWREVQKASKRTGRWGLSSCHPVKRDPARCQQRALHYSYRCPGDAGRTGC